MCLIEVIPSFSLFLSSYKRKSLSKVTQTLISESTGVAESSHSKIEILFTSVSILSLLDLLSSGDSLSVDSVEGFSSPHVVWDNWQKEVVVF